MAAIGGPRDPGELSIHPATGGTGETPEAPARSRTATLPLMSGKSRRSEPRITSAPAPMRLAPDRLPVPARLLPGLSLLLELVTGTQSASTSGVEFRGGTGRCAVNSYIIT